MGYVYLLHAVGTDYYKIGTTVNGVQYRAHALQTGCPFELRVLATIKSKHAHPLERRLHRRFKAYRVQGEWFKFDQHTPGIYETFGVKLTNTSVDEAKPEIRTVTETVYVDIPVVETVYVDIPVVETVYVDRPKQQTPVYKIVLAVMLLMWGASVFILSWVAFLAKDISVTTFVINMFSCLVYAVVGIIYGGQK